MKLQNKNYQLRYSLLTLINPWTEPHKFIEQLKLCFSNSSQTDILIFKSFPVFLSKLMQFGNL